MTDYKKLVEDLRDIEKTMFALGTSPINMDNVSIRLAYDKKWGRTANDAAAAIEELQQIADHHEQTAKDYWKEACEYKAQLPKRGEWERTQNGIDNCSVYKCSVCGSLWYGVGGYNYCPNCGAKMIGEQNVE